MVTEIPDEEVKFNIKEQEHKRENKDQILQKYFFPQMTKLINKYTKLCEIYGCNKYDRHPLKPKLQATPKPS